MAERASEMRAYSLGMQRIADEPTGPHRVDSLQTQELGAPDFLEVAVDVEQELTGGSIAAQEPVSVCNSTHSTGPSTTSPAASA